MGYVIPVKTKARRKYLPMILILAFGIRRRLGLKGSYPLGRLNKISNDLMLTNKETYHKDIPTWGLGPEVALGNFMPCSAYFTLHTKAK